MDRWVKAVLGGAAVAAVVVVVVGMVAFLLFGGPKPITPEQAQAQVDEIVEVIVDAAPDARVVPARLQPCVAEMDTYTKSRDGRIEIVVVYPPAGESIDGLLGQVGPALESMGAGPEVFADGQRAWFFSEDDGSLNGAASWEMGVRESERRGGDSSPALGVRSACSR